MSSRIKNARIVTDTGTGKVRVIVTPPRRQSVSAKIAARKRPKRRFYRKIGK